MMVIISPLAEFVVDPFLLKKKKKKQSVALCQCGKQHGGKFPPSHSFTSG